MGLKALLSFVDGILFFAGFSHQETFLNMAKSTLARVAGKTVCIATASLERRVCELCIALVFIYIACQ